MHIDDEPPTQARRFNLEGVDVYVFVHGHDQAAAALGLSEAELGVAAMVEDGRSNKEIANLLGTSEASVRRRLERLYRKLGITSRTGLVLTLQARRSSR